MGLQSSSTQDTVRVGSNRRDKVARRRPELKTAHGETLDQRKNQGGLVRGGRTRISGSARTKKRKKSHGSVTKLKVLGAEASKGNAVKKRVRVENPVREGKIAIPDRQSLSGEAAGTTPITERPAANPEAGEPRPKYESNAEWVFKPTK